MDGAIAAILYDFGLPPDLGTVVFVIGRIAGLAARVVEEVSREKPMRFAVPFAHDGPAG